MNFPLSSRIPSEPSAPTRPLARAVDEFKAWIDATPGVQQLMANAFAIGDINADISHACVQEYADGVRAFCRERVPVDTAVLGTVRRPQIF